MSTVAGFALLWDDVATIDGKPERFVAFAFREPLVAKLLISHDGRANAALARTSGGLRIWQNDHGLAFQAQLGDDRDARRALAAVRYGSLNSCSFGFDATLRDEDEDGVLIRQAVLREITLTGCGAFAGGGAWVIDAEQLDPKREALRALWHSSTTARRPGRIGRERAAFAASQRWAAGLSQPAPQVRAAVRTAALDQDPIRELARGHVGRYLGSR